MVLSSCRLSERPDVQAHWERLGVETADDAALLVMSADELWELLPREADADAMVASWVHLRDVAPEGLRRDTSQLAERLDAASVEGDQNARLITV